MRTVILALLLLAPPAFAEDYPGAPASVTAAYLEADGAGEALDPKTVPHLLSFTTWTSVKGPEPLVVIKSYDIGEVGWDEDKASVQIIYRVVGELSGSTFSAKSTDETIDFDLIKTEGKWKLVKPQIPPHLFIGAALKALGSQPHKSKAWVTSRKELQALAAKESAEK